MRQDMKNWGRDRKRSSSYQESHRDRKKKKKQSDSLERSHSHHKRKHADSLERSRSHHKRRKYRDYNKDEGKDMVCEFSEAEKKEEGQKKKKKKHSRSRSEHRKKEKKLKRSNDSPRKERVREGQESRSVSRGKSKHKRDKQPKYRRSRSHSRSPSDKFPTRREKERDANQRDYYRRDDRRKRNFRRREVMYDSSPSSNQSNMSDDPEKMDKLAKLKAEKELVSTKADRKLYLGNLPPNITSQQLMEMLNTALKKMQINTQEEGDSIVSAWISPDGVGHYAFVEFRSAQEASNGLALNGASLFGYQLKLGRPKQYIEYKKTLLSEMGTDGNLDTIFKKIAALGKQNLEPIEQRIVCAPSKIVVLKHIVSIEELGIDEEYNEILDDVTEMAKRFGTVVNIVVPRPHETIDLEHVQSRVKGLGLIFIEYKTISDAMSARKQFTFKEFSGHPVACCFFDEARFRTGNYDIQEKVIIDF